MYINSELIAYKYVAGTSTMYRQTSIDANKFDFYSIIGYLRDMGTRL